MLVSIVRNEHPAEAVQNVGYRSKAKAANLVSRVDIDARRRVFKSLFKTRSSRNETNLDGQQFFESQGGQVPVCRHVGRNTRRREKTHKCEQDASMNQGTHIIPFHLLFSISQPINLSVQHHVLPHPAHPHQKPMKQCAYLDSNKFARRLDVLCVWRSPTILGPLERFNMSCIIPHVGPRFIHFYEGCQKRRKTTGIHIVDDPK